MADKGTISLETIWTKAEMIVMRVCIIDGRPHADAAEVLNVSDRTVRRLIATAIKAAREVEEYGYKVNLDNSGFPCPE